ncbi:MAG: arabinose isomerase, partial [Planctomycetota bacterium]
MNEHSQARIACIGVGHHVYWPQFPDLRPALLGHHATICDRIAAAGCTVIDGGLIDDAASGEQAARRLRGSDADLVIIDMLTYATSATLMPLLRECDRPLLMLALQPLRGLDYARATTRMQLENDNVCSLPEFAGVALRVGRPIPP